MNVRLTDGTTTITLTSGAYEGVRYSPVAATVDEALSPGFSISESIWVRVAGTASEIQAARHAIGQLLATARRRRGSGRLQQVYVEHQSISGGDWYRAQILNGTVRSDDEPMLRRLDNGTNVIHVEFERLPYWEGPSTALTWGAGAASTATITNGDGSPYNAADLTDDSIVGELSAPIALRVKNNEGASVTWREFHLANLGEPDFTTTQHIITAATATSSWDPYTTHSNLRWICSVSDTVLAKCAGQAFRIVATFVSSTVGVYYRASVYAAIGGTYRLLASGPEVYNGLGLAALLVLDLGTLQIPPGGEDSATSGVVVVISARYATAGAATLDHVQLLPAEEYVFAEQPGYTTPDQAELVLDEVNGRVYLDAAVHYNIVSRRGSPLTVTPGRANRLAVLYMEGDGEYDPTRAIVLSGSYRPRRLTV
ncbi:MAG: hypothetical protein KDE20_01055 [Caldilineaceae bacterium]|nr:hypothetical protein [Caldilineaceae bacterium]